MERRKGAKKPLSVEWILALPIVFLTWILASGYALETEAAGGEAGQAYTDRFESEGGVYTLDYILRNYNVFCSGNYEGTHVVGPMVVDGKLVLNGALGGTTQGTGEYVHTAPSYIEGYAYNRHSVQNSVQNFPQILTANPGLPLYVGYDNHNKEQGKVGYTPYYYTPEEAYAKVGTSGTPIGASEQPDSVLDFEGYDAKGHKIDKIPMITNELISGIVKEHNEKYGTWQCNEDGILHYYHVGTDTGGKEFLKEVTDPEAIEKKEYALAIGTMYIEEENREKVNVRIRPGYNFSFESMDRIFSFVYVYDDIEEMFDSLTIIQSLQENDVLIPRIYKSIKDDAFGSNYGFGSVEKGPGFSTLWLAPNTSRVVVGFQTTEAKEGDVNGAKLVGHLAVPQADVVLGGGDFNGGVIAHNVDAITCGSEGHMWPFNAPEQKLCRSGEKDGRCTSTGRE